MSNIAMFESDKTPKYLKSVNTPDYENNPDVLVNPDLTAVRGESIEYWKRDGDAIIPMTTEEKRAVEAAKTAAETERIDVLSITVRELAMGLIACGLVATDEITTAIKEL